MQIKELYKKFLKAKGADIKYRNLVAGKKMDVSKKGLWDKKKRQVIVPSNRITMKGPNGEQDFFKKPVVATGLQSGQRVMMQPGGEYYFPNDKAVHEVRMQNGGSILSMGDYDLTTAPKKGNYLLPDINRPSYIDDTGERRTEYKIGKNIEGKETLIPTVVGGRQLTDDEAVDRYYKTGLHMGQFNTPEEANYAARLRTARYKMLEDPINFQTNQFQVGGVAELNPNTLGFQEGGSVQTDITTPIKQKQSASQDAFNAMLDKYEANKSNLEGDASTPEDMGFQTGGQLPVVIDSLFSNFQSGIGKKYAQQGMAVPGINGTVVANTNAPIDSEKRKIFDEGGWNNWAPKVDKPYMRTSPAGNTGYSDNTKVSTLDLANRKAAEAAQYARKVGSVTQGKVKSDYEKAREATSFVSQAEQRKGSADPLDHVLDMVNPASLAFAATDLVGNTGSAVSNVAQGNFKEAGSDLLNAGINALQVIPAAKAIKPFGSSVLKGVSRYADDVIQTSKIAGKPALPTYKNVYRTEHANFNKLSTPDDVTGRWALDDLNGAEFYVRNLKTPRGDGYVTKNYLKGEVEPVRIMRERLPEYKMKEQFAEGMPEQARIMSMGTGKLTDQELNSVLGEGAVDRLRKGIMTEMDVNTMSTAPFMYNPTEGILDANTINKLRQGENKFLGRGKTSLFPDQKKAVDYLDAQNKANYFASPASKYLPFSTYENGGEVEDDDDKEMVNGVASILRRVKDKKNRLQLANQLSKQFDREKVKYDLPSFLAKSKVKK